MDDQPEELQVITEILIIIIIYHLIFINNSGSISSQEKQSEEMMSLDVKGAECKFLLLLRRLQRSH